MDSGTSGGSMQSGSSGEDDQIDTNSFSVGVASIPRLHQHLPQTHLYQPTLTSQHLHYPPLTSIRSDDNNMSAYSPNHHISSNNSLFENLPQSDFDRIWSMNMNNVRPQAHRHNRQQQLFYSSTSSLEPSLSAMNPNPQITQDSQPKLPGRITSQTTQSGKDSGSSSSRAVKKRTRASRKTPTTVLTTDPTNFRAMVQEFTGIPSPPFGPSSLFPAKKFDLFGTNNVLDHPSLGSLLFSLNNSTTNNPNHNPTRLPPPLITTPSPINRNESERNQSTSLNPFQLQQQSQQVMLPQISNSAYINLHQGDQVKNPNMSFHQSFVISQRHQFPSKYSNSEYEADQRGGFSNVEREETDYNSRTG